MANHGPKKTSENGRSFSPTHCLCNTLGIYRRFPPRVIFQTPRKALFHPRSRSKSPNHAMEKVLTNETPGISLLALVSELNYRCFLRSRCSTEMSLPSLRFAPRSHACITPSRDQGVFQSMPHSLCCRWRRRSVSSHHGSINRHGLYDLYSFLSRAARM